MRRAVLVAGVALMLAACAPAEPPAGSVAERPAAAASPEAEAVVPPRYRREAVLADRRFAVAIRAAIAEAPTLAAGRAGEASAVARVAEARAALRPSVSLGLSAGRGLGASGEIAPRVRVSQRIFDGSAARLRTEAASLRSDRARAETALSVSDRVLLSIDAWQDLHVAREMRDLAQAALRRTETLAAQIERRLAAGAGRMADALRATARSADARAALAASEGRLAEAEARARALFGALPAASALPVAPPPVFDGAASPALRSLEAELAAARAELRARRAERAPTVFLDLVGGLDADDAPDMGASLRLDYALGTSGQRRAAIEAAEAEVARLEAEKVLLQSDIRRALASSEARQASLARELVAAREAEDTAAAALADAERGFDSGRIDGLDLLDLGRELDRAAMRRVELAAAQRLAGYERLALAGELLQTLGIALEAEDAP
ncbi:TolC family protein [Roseicyclus sp.]